MQRGHCEKTPASTLAESGDKKPSSKEERIVQTVQSNNNNRKLYIVQNAENKIKITSKRGKRHQTGGSEL